VEGPVPQLILHPPAAERRCGVVGHGADEPFVLGVRIAPRGERHDELALVGAQAGAEEHGEVGGVPELAPGFPYLAAGVEGGGDRAPDVREEPHRADLRHRGVAEGAEGRLALGPVAELQRDPLPVAEEASDTPEDEHHAHRRGDGRHRRGERAVLPEDHDGGHGDQGGPDDGQAPERQACCHHRGRRSEAGVGGVQGADGEEEVGAEPGEEQPRVADVEHEQDVADQPAGRRDQEAPRGRVPVGAGDEQPDDRGDHRRLHQRERGEDRPIDDVRRASEPRGGDEVVEHRSRRDQDQEPIDATFGVPVRHADSDEPQHGDADEHVAEREQQRATR
jgi:hypothetical protein